MKAKPRPGFVNVLTTLAVVLVVALPALAYKYPLSTSDIRNAYLLGTRKDSVTADFFAKYRHDLPMPRTGPYVADIIVATPYAQVVELGQSDLNSDSQQAEIDLAHKKFPFIVRVGINVTATYPAQPPNPAAHVSVPDFESDFKIQMTQNGQKIESKSEKVILLDDGNYGVTGAVLELHYEIGDVDPSGDVTIKVQTPDDQDIEVAFSLGNLQ
jgi:hypothetical protein